MWISDWRRAGLCADAFNISSFLAVAATEEVQMADACHNNQGPWWVSVEHLRKRTPNLLCLYIYNLSYFIIIFPMRKMAVLEDIHGLYTFSDTAMVTFCTCLTFATFVLHGLAQNGHEWTMFCDQLQIRGFICIWGWVQNRSWLIPRKLGGKDCW
jgi:hypothetical protein